MKTYSPQKKILIIKFGGLGDVVLSLNAISSIFNHHKSKMILLTEKPFDKFLIKSNWFYKTFTIKRSLFYFMDILQIKKKIKNIDFDYVYDLQTSKRSSFYLKFFLKTGAVTNGIGKFAQIRHLDSNRNNMHTVERQKEQIELSNIKFKLKDDFSWLVKSKIKIPKRKYVLVVPGGSRKRMNKRIPYKIYIDIVNSLIKSGLQVFLIGSNDDKKICKDIENKFPEVKNLCNKTDFFDLVKLAKNSFVSIGNDTGPMHLIAKGGQKTFVFFTKHSNPDLCKPVGKKVLIFLYEKNYEKFYKQIILELKNISL